MEQKGFLNFVGRASLALVATVPAYTVVTQQDTGCVRHHPAQIVTTYTQPCSPATPWACDVYQPQTRTSTTTIDITINGEDVSVDRK